MRSPRNAAVISTFVHVAAVAALCAGPLRAKGPLAWAPPARDASREEDLTSLEIAVLSDPHTEREPLVGALHAPSSGQPSEPLAYVATHEKPGPESEGRGALPPVPTEPNTGDGWSLNPTDPLGRLGVGQSGRALVEGSLGSSKNMEPTPPHGHTDNVAIPVDQMLKNDARQHESALGLGPDGPVRQTLTALVQSSEADPRSKAVFEVRTDARGLVLAVQLVQTNTARAPYERVGEALFQKLQRTPLRLPTSTKQGATLRLEVISEVKLPSGQDPGTNLDVLGVRVKNGEGKQSGTVSVLDPIPKVTCVAPDDPKNPLKLPICGVRLDLLSVQVDPSNIGATPRRVVHTKLLSQSIL